MPRHAGRRRAPTDPGRLDHNSQNISTSDTFGHFHEYEIRWTPDRIEWYVDGELGRSRHRKDTWNDETQQWDFPQTPARVQLSLWPGGLASNEAGTIQWAGGEIDWDAQDIHKAGYYYATVSEVSIECYDAKKAPGTNSGKSYVYGDPRGTNDTVVDGDKDTVLGSLEATGLNMDKGKKKKQHSSTESAEKHKKTQQTVPGGGSETHHHEGASETKGNDGSSQDRGPPGCDITKFSQSCDGDRGSKSGSSKTSASALTIIVVGSALMWPWG